MLNKGWYAINPKHTNTTIYDHFRVFVDPWEIYCFCLFVWSCLIIPRGDWYCLEIQSLHRALNFMNLFKNQRQFFLTISLLLYFRENVRTYWRAVHWNRCRSEIFIERVNELRIILLYIDPQPSRQSRDAPV